VTWQYEGPKVKVIVRQGFSIGDDSGELFWMVKAVNVGRSPIELLGWGFEVSDESSIVMLMPHPSSTPLRHTLNGGHDATFFMLQDGLRESLSERGGLPQTVRPYVSTTVKEKIHGERLVIPA
jgi:hypothetical protein